MLVSVQIEIQTAFYSSADFLSEKKNRKKGDNVNLFLVQNHDFLEIQYFIATDHNFNQTQVSIDTLQFSIDILKLRHWMCPVNPILSLLLWNWEMNSTCIFSIFSSNSWILDSSTGAAEVTETRTSPNSKQCRKPDMMISCWKRCGLAKMKEKNDQYLTCLLSLCLKCVGKQY